MAEDVEEAARRFAYDRSLLAALVDRWRPETHTFHFPCGEMAPTLEDVSFLCGLPTAGQAVSAPDVPVTWRADLEARFQGIVRRPGAPAYRPLAADQHHGPTKNWLLQFTVKICIALYIVIAVFGLSLLT